MNDSSIPILGDGWKLDLIHITGITCITISEISCMFIFIHAFYYRVRIQKGKPFFARPIGDRLIVYVAITALGCCTSDLVNHAYIHVHRAMPSDMTCAWMAFFIMAFAMVYQLIHAYIALAALMLVRNKSFSTGRYDWKVLAGCLGVGFLIATVLLATQQLGQGLSW